ncbi:MAG: tRNA uridine(34) 5-carboxymethylaminomethyl modification radical SAM/GNAT enzyme Elp3 [Methanobacteriota archaeon]
MNAIEEIIQEIKLFPNKREIYRIKIRATKKYRLAKIPTNAEILEHASRGDLKLLLPLLRKKPVRTISGIAVVAAMARPYPCPGECIYCPKGENAPQSYTGKEPAALRAKRANYDPYLQVEDRLTQLQSIGHTIDKAELIVMGGTFTAQPLDYQKQFVNRCLEAMEEFNSKNVGITFEIRPDFAKERHANEMLGLGVTRVELGVQTIKDSVYEKINRGHSVRDVIEATQILKDAGLKVGYHMMPGLFSNFEEDLEMFETLFEDERFRPDFLKIYPTLVIKGTKLYDMWMRGEFQPYNDEEAIGLIAEIKLRMPKWIRTMRVQRDIPSYLIEAGVKKGDLGELVYQELKERNLRCKCIRCRDVGHRWYKEGIEVDEGSINLLDEEYSASEGIEHFLSVEDTSNDTLIAYLRLRFPSQKAHRKEIDEKTALVRELRVLGQAVPVGARIPEAEQHKGFGAALLKKAEEISAESGMRKILVTSAIGTRDYYRRFGYRRVGPYMGKKL